MKHESCLYIELGIAGWQTLCELEIAVLLQYIELLTGGMYERTTTH